MSVLLTMRRGTPPRVLRGSVRRLPAGRPPELSVKFDCSKLEYKRKKQTKISQILKAQCTYSIKLTLMAEQIQKTTLIYTHIQYCRRVLQHTSAYRKNVCWCNVIAGRVDKRKKRTHAHMHRGPSTQALRATSRTIGEIYLIKLASIGGVHSTLPDVIASY